MGVRSTPVKFLTGCRGVDVARHWDVSPAHFDKLVAEGVAPVLAF